METAQTVRLLQRYADERLDLRGSCLRAEFEQRAEWPSGYCDYAIGFGLFARCGKSFSEDAKGVGSCAHCARNRGQRLAAVPRMANAACDRKRLLGALWEQLVGGRAACYIFGSNVIQRHAAMPNV